MHRIAHQPTPTRSLFFHARFCQCMFLYPIWLLDKVGTSARMCCTMAIFLLTGKSSCQSSRADRCDRTKSLAPWLM